MKNKKYLAWKRKNVTFRGMQEMGEYNGGSAILGNGLYTAALSNKAMAKGYGKVYFVVGGVPKNPKVFNTLNDWEIWFYNTLITQYTDGFPDKKKFLAETTIEAEVQKLGFDGIVIK